MTEKLPENSQILYPKDLVTPEDEADLLQALKQHEPLTSEQSVAAILLKLGAEEEKVRVRTDVIDPNY